MTDHIKPSSASWIYKGRQPFWPKAHVFDHLDGTRLLSGVEDVTGDGPNYHVSVSRSGHRISAYEARQIILGLASPFPAEQWFEDNHQSSIARNFWANVDPAKRKPCECIANEKPTQEGDFTWRKDPKT